jgi:hypothetical protein
MSLMARARFEEVTREAVEKSQDVFADIKSKGDVLVAIMKRVAGPNGWTGAETTLRRHASRRRLVW